MKVRYSFDHDVDECQPPESSDGLIEKIVFSSAGIRRLVRVYPKGYVRETSFAPLLCNRGAGRPADDECRNACLQFTDAQREKLELEYAADMRGIWDKDDRELFFKGIILGYEKIDDRFAYLPGPNWDEYRKSIESEKVKKQQDDQGI